MYDPKTFPSDVVVIDEATYLELINKPSQGLEIVGDAAGQPVAVAPELTAEQLVTRALSWRNSALVASDAITVRHRDQIDGGFGTTLTGDEYSALLVYRQALRDWPTADGFPADSSKPPEPDWLAAAEATE